MSEIQGRLSGDRGWAVPRAARLTAHPEGIHITADDGTVVEAAWTDVHIKSSLTLEGSSILQARTANGHVSSFEAPGATLLRVVRTFAPSGFLQTEATLVEGLETKKRRSIGRQLLFIGLMLATTIGLFAWSLHALPGLVVSRIPIEWEEGLGQATLPKVKGEGTVLTSGPAYDAVHKVWARLEPALPPSPYKFQLTVVDAPVVNAFAMPGGYVVVYTGLLEELDSPEALAGILGHEASHVIRKHSLRAMVSAMQWRMGVAILWGIFGGSSDKTVAQMQEQAASLLTLAHSRTHESEADADGLRALNRAGIDPGPFSRFFLVLARKEGKRLAILSTHPPSEERAASLDAFAKTLPAAKTTPIDVDWKALRKYLRTHPSQKGNDQP